MVIEGNPFSPENVGNPHVYEDYILKNKTTSRSFIDKNPAKSATSIISEKTTTRTKSAKDSPKTQRKNKKLNKICDDLIG